MNLEKILFGDYSKRQIKKLTPAAQAVDGLADKYRAMSEDELRGTTAALRARLDGGETLDQLLPDAFAAVREAADRVLGKRPFFVQILGGILLHQGRIAEMKTGEGKTLVATMPAYLNAIGGNGVHIVTVNDYLAQRDAEEMGRVYEYLGLRTGVVLNGMSIPQKQAMYAADITYGTNTEFGFDYLRDNIARNKAQLLQRGHNFCIVDEIDSILIDEARTPLIISGVSDKTSDIYEKCDACARRLRPKVIKEMDTKQETDDENFDYIVEEKNQTAVLTPRGVRKVEEFFGIDQLNDPENAVIAHNMNQAIHAHGVKKRDVDYVVIEGEVIIVDPFTGRLMHGRRYQDGLHQAIEAKEKVNVKGESRVAATVTIQNYFRLYKKLSGMTGTAMTEESEFREIYGLDVVEVPTNKPMIRTDHPDRVFIDEKHKFDAIVKQVGECMERGQPVLIGTASVEKSEKLAKLLRSAGIKFNMLNAKDHEREAETISEAGRPGVVTLATNMAGRGTDIMLGGNPEHMAKAEMTRLGIRKDLIPLSSGTAPTEDKDILNARNTFRMYYEKFREKIEPDRQAVIAAGGLYIIGSERHESRRIDNQLRGRSGRQGDPGESTFFVSLQDDIMRLFGDDRIKRFAAVSAGLVTEDGDGDLSAYLRILSDISEKAQKNMESANFRRRKNVLQYDDILNEQRKQIYSQRSEILMDGDVSEKIRDMITSTVTESVAGAVKPSDDGRKEVFDTEALYRKYQGWALSAGEIDFAAGAADRSHAEKVTELITANALALYDKRACVNVTEGQENMIRRQLPDGTVQEGTITVQPDELRGMFRIFENNVLLDAIDDLWLDHIDNMEDLRQNVMLQSYAQRDPLNEYRIIGTQMYSDMIDEIRQRTVREVLTRRVEVQYRVPESGIKGLSNLREGAPSARTRTQAPAVNAAGSAVQKAGPNDPCPCGSGKKYKKCCGAGKSSSEG